MTAGAAPTRSRTSERGGARRPDPSWGLLFKAGGWSALLYVLLVLLPVVALAGGTETAFDLNSTDSTYPFVTRLQGSISERHDSLIIEMTKP